MNFKQLIQQTPWEAVREKINKTDKDAKENMQEYEKMYFELRDILEPKIEVGHEEEELYVGWDATNMYLEAYIKKTNDGGYALDFVPWDLCLALKVAPISMETLEPAEIIASAMHDMTWDGFDQETIKQSLERLKDRNDNIEN